MKHFIILILIFSSPVLLKTYDCVDGPPFPKKEREAIKDCSIDDTCLENPDTGKYEIQDYDNDKMIKNFQQNKK